MTCLGTKFKVATSNGLGGDTFTRNVTDGRTHARTDEGAKWLSGRVLDSRPKGCGFESHWRHCVVVLEQDTFILA